MNTFYPEYLEPKLTNLQTGQCEERFCKSRYFCTNS